MAEPVAIRYRAFLSYSHADTAWAKWLHAALEGFRIDKDLAGRPTLLGPVPPALRPIFRDREDFSGGHTLTDATIAALDAAAALIVICSSIAATRPAVNEEVRLFRSRHPQRPVIPVIVEGSYPDNFPPALRYALAPDGTLTDTAITILGPDLRESGDGKTLGVAKVVAGLIGVPSDDIFRRAERARRRRNRFWAGLAGVFLLLAVAASGSAVYAWQQLRTNEAFLNAALKRAAEIVDEAVAQAEKYSVPRAATLALLTKAEGLFDDMALYGRQTPELRYRKALMLIQFARNYAILGDTGKRRARAIEAHRLLADLAAENPDDVSYQGDLSAALDEIGKVLVTQGNLAEALTSYRASLAITERLARADPDATDWQDDLAQSYERIGDVLVAQGKVAEALTSFRDSLAITERLAKANSDNTDWQRNLSVSYGKVGDVLVAQGKLAEALTSFRDSLVVRKRLATADPNNAGWQSDLAESYKKIGEVLSVQGNLPQALTAFRDSLAIIERLAKTDPNNAEWQNDLAGAYDRVGDVLVAQGKVAEALTSFRDSLAIMQRLAKADPADAGWQRDLVVANQKIGDVLLAQGKLAEALTVFRDSLATMQRLAKTDPSNAGWQSDLAESYKKVGDVLLAEGILAEALTSFRDSLAIMQRLAKADPSNAGWQNDLAVSYNRVGDVMVAQGNLAEALTAFRNSLAIMERLAKADTSNAGWQNDLAESSRRVGDVLVQQGNLAEALISFRASLTIRERLARADPSNTQWQWDFVLAHWRLAEHGDDPAHRWALVVAEMHRLRDEDRLRPDWERLLPEAEAQLAKYQSAEHTAR